MRKREDGPVPAGVTVIVCEGHRCRALRDRTDTGVAEGECSTLLGALRDRVRRSRRAVLIRSECLGVCARAPVVGVLRPAATGRLYGPVENPAQVRDLLESVVAAEGAGG